MSPHLNGYAFLLFLMIFPFFFTPGYPDSVPKERGMKAVDAAAASYARDDTLFMMG